MVEMTRRQSAAGLLFCVFIAFPDVAVRRCFRTAGKSVPERSFVWCFYLVVFVCVCSKPE